MGNLYRAVDSAGDTIDFLLSPKRDLTAAKLFLRLALSGTSGIRPRVINLDGHPGICSCHCRAEAVGRSRTTLPMSTITLFKQRHRAGPSIYQEAHCGACGSGRQKDRVWEGGDPGQHGGGRKCVKDDGWLRSDASDPEGVDPLAAER